jgi:hypothetical protein
MAVEPSQESIFLRAEWRGNTVSINPYVTTVQI